MARRCYRRAELADKDGGSFFPSPVESSFLSVSLSNSPVLYYIPDTGLVIPRCISSFHRQTAIQRTTRTARLLLPSGERHKARLLSVRITKCEWHALCFLLFPCLPIPNPSIVHVRGLAAGVQIGVISQRGIE